MDRHTKAWLRRQPAYSYLEALLAFFAGFVLGLFIGFIAGL